MAGPVTKPMRMATNRNAFIKILLRSLIAVRLKVMFKTETKAKTLDLKAKDFESK